MARLKFLVKNFGCRRILANLIKSVRHTALSVMRKMIALLFDKRSDPASSDFSVGAILRFLQVLMSFSGRYCIFLFLLLPTFAFLLFTFNFAFAGGYIYWTPDGVLLNDFDDGVGGPVDDGKGGAILFSIRLYGISQDSVVALRIDSNGNSLWGLQGKTLDNYAGEQGRVMGVSDGRGGAIAIWPRFPFQPTLYCQRVDSLGNRIWGANAQRVTLSDSQQWYPAVKSDGAKGMIVTWQERWGIQGSNFNYDIYVQRIDSSGVRCWSDYGVPVCTADSSQETPAITSDINGNSIIVWDDLRSGSYDVYAQRFSNTGSPSWLINGIPVCNAESAQGIPSYGSPVITASDTTTIVSWGDLRNGNRDLYAQCLDNNGLSLWPAQGIPICDTINYQGGGVVVADGQGGAVFCWVDERNGFKNIYAQRLDANGNKLWQNQGVPICNTDSAYWYQRIVPDGRSGAIICWQDNRSGNWDIYAQHIDSLGNLLWEINGMPVCTVVDVYERYPEMIASDSNTAIICWLDCRNGSSQVRGYAQKVGDEVSAVGEVRSKKLEVRSIVLEFVPNPFSTQTSIRYRIEDAGYRIPENQMQDVRSKRQDFSLKIYDATGRLVKSFNHLTSCLFNQIVWDGKDSEGKVLPSGVYFCELVVNEEKLIKKVVLLR